MARAGHDLRKHKAARERKTAAKAEREQGAASVASMDLERALSVHP